MSISWTSEKDCSNKSNSADVPRRERKMEMSGGDGAGDRKIGR